MNSTDCPTARALVTLGLLMALAACDDDPAAPDPGTTNSWVEVDLGVSSSDPLQLIAIDCADDACVALGIEGIGSSGTSRFWQTTGDGNWTSRNIAGPPDVFTTDLALHASGAVVTVGFDPGATSSVVHDERTATPSTVSFETSALMTVDGDDDFFVAGGLIGGGHLVSSESAGSWTQDDFPSSGRNDRGFWDVDVRGDLAAACGFDDGADTLQVVLRRTRTTSWEALNRDGLPYSVALRSIAIDDDGAVFVGGTLRPGSLDEEAFAAVRNPAGEWIALILPDAERLGRVNDILIARDGSIYLACSSEYEDTSTAHLLRASDAGVASEITPFDGQLLQLAETGDGTVYAVGSRRTGSSPGRVPVVLRRSGR